MDEIQPDHLRPLRMRFQQERSRLGISWEIIEQDYLLSWMLAAISLSPLKDALVFKGGTALKKCYFEDYRFSQDLDFSINGNVPHSVELLYQVQEACSIAKRLIRQQRTNIEIKCEPYKEKHPHPFGQEAFTILAQYPWHNKYSTRVMVEITMEEPVLVRPTERAILHGYDEQIVAIIKVYALEEIVAEKIRAILQYAKKLHERGWGRSRARDYYDLWRILSQEHTPLNLAIIPSLIEKKCALKGVTFATVDDLFTQELMTDLTKAWGQWLRPLVPDLPDMDVVLRELKERLVEIGLV